MQGVTGFSITKIELIERLGARSAQDCGLERDLKKWIQSRILIVFAWGSGLLKDGDGPARVSIALRK